jgi:hypothetical protein
MFVDAEGRHFGREAPEVAVAKGTTEGCGSRGSTALLVATVSRASGRGRLSGALPLVHCIQTRK